MKLRINLALMNFTFLNFQKRIARTRRHFSNRGSLNNFEQVELGTIDVHGGTLQGPGTSEQATTSGTSTATPLLNPTLSAVPEENDEEFHEISLN
jgi:hypothetical protein